MANRKIGFTLKAKLCFPKLIVSLSSSYWSTKCATSLFHLILLSSFTYYFYLFFFFQNYMWHVLSIFTPSISSSQIHCGDIKANFFSLNILRCISYWNMVRSFRHIENAVPLVEDKDCQCRAHFCSTPLACWDLIWLGRSQDMYMLS